MVVEVPRVLHRPVPWAPAAEDELRRALQQECPAPRDVWERFIAWHTSRLHLLRSIDPVNLGDIDAALLAPTFLTVLSHQHPDLFRGVLRELRVVQL